LHFHELIFIEEANRTWHIVDTEFCKNTLSWTLCIHFSVEIFTSGLCMWITLLTDSLL